MCTSWYITIELPFFKNTDFYCVRKSITYKCFNDDELKILWKKFEKGPFISKKEAENLAEMLNVQQDKIYNWFRRQRSRGGWREIERVTEGKHFLTILNFSVLLYIFV